MATKSSVGWLILAFALAVPGVLFYQWYTHLDLEKKKALSMKVRLSETGLFQNSPKKDKLVNPIAQAAPPATAQPASSSSAPAAGLPAAAVPPGEAPPPDAAPAEASVPPGLPDQAADADAAVAGSTGSLINTFLAWRDPTLSPYDQVRMEQMELEKQIRLQELQEAAEQRAKPAHKPQVQIEKLIDLQGIVSAGGTNKAIVNNEVVGEGDLVKTSAGTVKIMRITTQGVAFAFKDKRFNKSVSR
ncbi:MAG: hypothetical protein HY926_10255 [Elusimicrobia bacterium]|nr:hypothetical protein [Elusimicrobiota bacterium]